MSVRQLLGCHRTIFTLPDFVEAVSISLMRWRLTCFGAYFTIRPRPRVV